MRALFADIHCHLLPSIDDGASDLETSLAMAEMAVADGIHTIVVTPHQLGSFGHNTSDQIRGLTQELQHILDSEGIPLEILPGADVRIEEGMIEKLVSGEVLTLGDHRRHVLLELPHEMYFPLDNLLTELDRKGIIGILSHPERNAGLLRDPHLLLPLVDRGCLMQVTAGSLMGTKTILNEFIAYLNLAALPADALTDRSKLLMVYAMCGFANLGSVGMMIAGVSALAPSRREEIVQLSLWSIIPGTLSTCMTAAVVGLLPG